jgi:hypothetical protein
MYLYFKNVLGCLKSAGRQFVTHEKYKLWKVLVLHFRGWKDKMLLLDDLVILVGIMGLGTSSSDVSTIPLTEMSLGYPSTNLATKMYRSHIKSVMQ